MDKNPFADDRPDVETIRQAARLGAEERGYGKPPEGFDNAERTRMTIDGPKAVLDEYRKLCKVKRFAQWEGLLAFIEKETGKPYGGGR